MKVGSGVFQGPFSFASRFESGPGTNPEELIAAAQAGCFSMALSAALSAAGLPPRRISTTAVVHLEAGPAITLIELTTEADVPKVDEATFQRIAEDAKKNCPVSKALAGTEIRLKATLVK
jgi:osmotically inducible protein OsmC